MPPAGRPTTAAPPRRRVWLVVNPSAGRGRGQVVGDRIRDHLLAHRVGVCDVGRKPPADMTRPDAVVAVGGDGTVRAAVGLAMRTFGGDGLPPLLPVPLGTANLLGQAIGVQPGGLASVVNMTLRGLGPAVQSARQGIEPALPDWSRRLLTRGVRRLSVPARDALLAVLPSPQEQADAWARRVLATLRRPRQTIIDVCTVNDAVFLLMAGVGFDAHVVHGLEARRRGPVGPWSYVLPAARSTTGYAFPPVEVRVDARRVFGPKPAAVLAANLPQYGTGFEVVPGADPADGLLDVLCLPCAGRAELARLLGLAAAGDHLDAPGTVRVRGRHVVVDGPDRTPVQADGDAHGYLPADIRVTGTRLRLLGFGPPPQHK